MGEHQVETGNDEREERAFMRALLNDIAALERMLESGTPPRGSSRSV